MSNKKNFETRKPFLDIVSKILGAVTLAKSVKNYTMDTDLLSVGKAARVRPICVISKELTYSEYYKDILEMNLINFTSIYMSAIPMINVIGKTKVANMLAQVNPDRDFDTFLGLESEANGYGVTDGSFAYGLPSKAVLDRMGAEVHNMVGLEDDDDDIVQAAAERMKEIESGVEFKSKTSSSDLDGDRSVVVGKQITVDLIANDVTIPVDVNVQLASYPVNSDLIAAVLSHDKTENSLTESYHRWRAGELAFFKEFLGGLHLLENHKKLLMNDDIGFYKEAKRRSRNGKLWGILTRAPSLAEASNIYIIDMATKKAVERKLRGKLTQEKIKAKVFAESSALLICVIDEVKGRMETHYRTLAGVTVTRLKDIKKKSKKDDMMEMIAIMQQGSSPKY